MKKHERCMQRRCADLGSLGSIKESLSVLREALSGQTLQAVAVAKGITPENVKSILKLATKALANALPAPLPFHRKEVFMVYGSNLTQMRQNKEFWLKWVDIADQLYLLEDEIVLAIRQGKS